MSVDLPEPEGPVIATNSPGFTARLTLCTVSYTHLYLMIGGAPLGMAYKAVNTLDSMVGYKNERYIDFGRASARLDDAVNRCV